MTNKQRCVLILGGTGDAAALARACATTFPQMRIVSSLAGRTRQPMQLVGETHIGGFGGVHGLVDFISENRVAACIDATHPFAAQISQHAAAACMTCGVARLQLLREPWTATAADWWIEVDDMDAAANTLTSQFADAASTGNSDDNRRVSAPAFRSVPWRVFLSTGRQQLSSFAHLRNTWFLIRTVDPLGSSLVLAHSHALVSRGPFDAASELALLKQHRIDIVISKNSGGDATFAKILAARRLQLPVIMLRRPAAQAGPVAHTIDQSIEWLSAQL